jgi:hypothetical protein
MITFVTKISETVSGKAAGQNSRKRMGTYVEDNLDSPTKPGTISPVCSRRVVIRGSLKE